MALPPDSEFRACMRVIYMAILDARVAGWQSDVNPERLADLMDTIHNIPNLVQHWESCDVDSSKERLLNFERKWKEDGPYLRAIYEQSLLDSNS